MSAEAERIRAEYRRRAAEIPADRYDPVAPVNVFFRQGVERAALAALRRAGALPLTGHRVLDVGCGVGAWLALLETWGARRADLAGIDLVPDRVTACRERLAGADIRLGDGAELPWETGTFDVVLQSVVFSSILAPEVRRGVADEMARVLAPSGVVLWYDFFVGNPANPHVRRIGRDEIRSLFPGFSLDLRRATLAPPLARALVPRLRPLAVALGAAHVADTHHVGTLRRQQPRPATARQKPAP
ncbi:class I SAM-dependent methyltransferase [Actinomycetospora sp. CA-101289]|uniref:class I SAM-dependent methyltransferase n=1 Tax=Actinomycetospora sp. CA-101289 TaxID=3239893 RepID=UPI003D956614